MDPQITLSQRLFYIGLFIMLGAGIASVTAWSGAGQALSLLALTGAILAVGARAWRNRLVKSFRDHNTYNHLRRPPAAPDYRPVNQNRRVA